MDDYELFQSHSDEKLSVMFAHSYEIKSRTYSCYECSGRKCEFFPFLMSTVAIVI